MILRFRALSSLFIEMSIFQVEERKRARRESLGGQEAEGAGEEGSTVMVLEENGVAAGAGG